MAAQQKNGLIRSTWYWSKHKRRKHIKNFRLYPDRLTIVTWKLFRRSQEVIPMKKIERADLVPRHKRRDMVLVIRFKSGKKILSTVPGPIYWRDAINGLLGISLLDWKEAQGAPQDSSPAIPLEAAVTASPRQQSKPVVPSPPVKENLSFDDLEDVLNTRWIHPDIAKPLAPADSASSKLDSAA